MREAIYFDGQIEPWMHHPTLRWLQIQIVAEGIGWSWIVKLLIWASRVTLVLKDIKQSSQWCLCGLRSLVPDCQEHTRVLLTSKAADTWHVSEVWTLNTDPRGPWPWPGSITTWRPWSLLGQQQRTSVVRQSAYDLVRPVLFLSHCCCVVVAAGHSWAGCCCAVVMARPGVVECQGWIGVR